MRALATITRNTERAKYQIGQQATIAVYHAPPTYTGPCLAVLFYVNRVITTVIVKNQIGFANRDGRSLKPSIYVASDSFEYISFNTLNVITNPVVTSINSRLNSAFEVVVLLRKV